MRSALAVVVFLVLSGCMGGGPRSVDSLSKVDGVFFRILTVNDEQVPIPNATVYIGRDPQPFRSSDIGELILLDVPAGTQKVRAWAPNYYRTQQDLVVRDNVTELLVLARRPDDKVFPTQLNGNGNCFLSAHTRSHTEPCRAQPTTSDVVPPPVSFSISLPQREGDCETGARRFEYVALNFQWTGSPLGYTPMLEAKMMPEGRITVQNPTLRWTGVGPYLLKLNLTEIWPDALDGAHRILFTPSAAPASQEHAILSLGFSYTEERAHRCMAPPAIPW